MGLSISHNTFRRSYGAFRRWRLAITQAAELPLVECFEGDMPMGLIADIDWDSYAGNLEGEWDEYPDDPILVLIAHSDCSGKIYHDITFALAERLRELLSEIEDPHGWGWKETTEQFIAGLMAAFEAGEDLEFR